MSYLWTLHYNILKSIRLLGEKTVCKCWSVLYSEWEYQIELDRGWQSEAVEEQIDSNLNPDQP